MVLVPIGRFSRMTRLSSKALRLYDESGLLPPAHVDPASGYRYYDPSQANRAEAVRILRSVDMPLDEIKAVLDADDVDLVHKRLDVHRQRLAARLAEDERMLTYLETIAGPPREIYLNDPQTVQPDDLRTRVEFPIAGAPI